MDVIIPASLSGGADGGYTLDDVRQLIPATHVDFVDDILARYDVAPLPDNDTSDSLTTFGSLGDTTPFSADAAGAQLEIALAHRSAFVANALGPPPQHMIDAAKDAGKLVGGAGGPGPSTPSATRTPEWTSSSPRGTRPAATPASSARWC